jgi:hypothetical protein
MICSSWRSDHPVGYLITLALANLAEAVELYLEELDDPAGHITAARRPVAVLAGQGLPGRILAKHGRLAIGLTTGLHRLGGPIGGQSSWPAIRQPPGWMLMGGGADGADPEVRGQGTALQLSGEFLGPDPGVIPCAASFRTRPSAWPQRDSPLQQVLT